ncbi:ribosome biogenesis GTPase YqeH [Terrilactibacillus sp. BCM23-1]|uniref:Ribosome biogenesis GTPase YqeH n=1 Tax=Terrilactibacillus tamarindi TaxID=2599694 RepID=A0A6N8CTS8_9BACI|nr:ribosome biogenesis GTPase YqeH [Terrilactibacillus tamarindi]MTT32483.1 ribosome biogenesis GTPase YqeH [Terrilactibacillus tamarindi]
MSDAIFCAGCGIPIQTLDKKQLGYAPPSALERETVICQRCFRLKHYHEIQDVSLTDDDFLKMLSKIGQTKALVVNIIDIFDFSGSWVPGLQRLVGKNPILLVGNKVDLLPKSTNKNKLKNWMQHEVKELGLKPLDVLLMSAEKKIGIQEVAEAIDYYRKGQDVYIVGCTNVGKSTFINQLIHQVTGEEEVITTSNFPGTTLNFIDIPLEDGHSLYDTPGVVNHHQVAHYIQDREYKIVMPKKEIKPKVFQLNEAQTLFLGGLARLDYVRGGRRSLVVYVSNDLYIHRTKQENADELYENQYGELLKPPSDPSYKLPEMKRHDFVIKDDEMDIVFSGLGWITVKGTDAHVTAYAPDGIGVMIRKTIIQ